jgi:hypothetical protein
MGPAGEHAEVGCGHPHNGRMYATAGGRELARAEGSEVRAAPDAEH